MMGNKTPLYDVHIQLGAQMIEFAGWELPVRYSSIFEEHAAVRNAVGIFDVSHMGKIEIEGEGAKDLLEKVLPTRLSKLSIGRSMYSCLCNERGGVIDDLFVYMKSPTKFFLVSNALQIAKVFAWLHKWNNVGAIIKDVSKEFAKIDVQGPRALEVVKPTLKDDRIATLPRFSFIECEFEGMPLMISQSGYTGEYGFEIYVHSACANILWQKLFDAGKTVGLLPCGLGARDILRLEAAYSLYGHELDEETTPIEAGIGWVVSSETDYIGKKVLEEQKRNGAPKETICFECTQKGIARENCTIFFDKRQIGHVTSATFSPVFKTCIGMARVKSGMLKNGCEISIAVRDKYLQAKVVPRPFLSYRGYAF